MKSQELFERSRAVSPGGVHSPVRSFRGVGGTPVFIRSAAGAELEDVEGKKYIDFCMSWGPLIFGHQDPEVSEAVQAALTRGWSYGTAEPYSLELAELITSSIPWVEKIRFVNSGTEAVMSALRLARGVTGRSKILKFDGCYHGHVDSLLVKAGSGLADMASPDSAGVSAAVASETIIVPLNDIVQLENAFALHGKEIAAAIVEAIPANNGLLLQKDGFLTRLSQLTRASGALLILDEVITGFRVAFGGMAERIGLRPDLVTYGKIIGGGFPVGAFGGRAEFMDLVAPLGPVYQAGTLSANPIAMTAGLTMLKKLKKTNPYESLEKKTEELARSLERVAWEMDYPLTVQNYASIFWMVCGERRIPADWVRSHHQVPSQHKERYVKSFHSFLNQGFYLAPSAFEVSFLSTVHTSEHLEKLQDAFKKAVSE